MAGNKNEDIANAFARISNNLSQKTTVTPFDKSSYTQSLAPKDYQYQEDFSDVDDVSKRYGAQFNQNGVIENTINIPRRVAGAFGEVAEQVVGSVANGAGAANRLGVDDRAQTAFSKMQDQKNNKNYQDELNQLRTNPQALISSGARIDMRDVNERIGFLENRLQKNQLSQEEYGLLYNPDGTETHAKQRLNWSQAAADNGEYLTGNRDKGTTGFLNARNWYDHSAEKAYQGHKAWNGTKANENAKLARDAQDAYDNGDTLGWLKNQGKVFLNSAKDSAKALAANPQYAFEEAAGMAPYILPQTRGIAIAADAARIQNQSHDQFTDRELRAPTAGETLGITAMTGVYTGANYAEALIARGALKGQGVAKSLGLASKVVSASERSAATQAFGRLAGTMIGEGATEAVQEQIESKWGSLDPTLDASAMGEAFTMGAAIGGTLGAPSAVGKAVVGTGLQVKAKATAKAIEKAIAKNPEMDKNTTTEELADVDSPKFNAEAATVRMTQEAATAEKPEDVQAIKAKYEDMVTKADMQLTAINEVIGIHENLEKLQGQKAQVEAIREQQLAADPNADVSRFDTALDMLSGQLERHDAIFGSQEEADVYAKRESLTQELSRAEDMLSRSSKLADTADVNPTAISSKVLGAPSQHTADQLAKAATDVKYSAPEQEILRKLSESRQAYDELQTISGVSKDILHGSDQSKSLISYADDMGKAIVTGNERLKKLTLNMLNNFARSHESKANTVEEAFNLYQQTNTPIEVFRTQAGTWAINDSGTKFTKVERKANGALTIDHRSTNLVAAIPEESAAIQKTLEAVQLMADTKFETKPQGVEAELDTQLANNDALKNAQDLAEQGRDIKKSAPVNTPVDPTENNWEGLEAEPAETTPIKSKTTPPKVTPAKKEEEEPKTIEDKRKAVAEHMTTSMKGKSAEKYLTKELVKVNQATQFIGEGTGSTGSHTKSWESVGLANTGKYTKDDVVMVAANGKRKDAFIPVKDGVLQGKYKNLDKAIAVGATIIGDTEAHLKATNYNTGELALAEYLTSKGYTHDGKGVWKPGNPVNAIDVDPTFGLKYETTYTIKTILDKLYAEDSQELLKLAKALVSYNPAMKLMVVKDPENHKLKWIKDSVHEKSARAFYGKNTIVINQLDKLVAEVGNGVTELEVLTHEMSHLVTSHTVANQVMIDNPSKEMQAIKDEILDIQRTIKDYLLNTPEVGDFTRDRLSYMVDSANEIFTVGISEPKAVAELQKIPYGDSNIYQRLVGLISKLLGFTKDQSTMYDRILELTDTLAEIQAPRTQQTAPVIKAETPTVEVESVVDTVEAEAIIDEDAGTTEQFEPDYLDLAEVNAELKSLREEERKKALADRNLVLDGANRTPTILGLLSKELASSNRGEIIGSLNNIAQSYLKTQFNEERALTTEEQNAIKELTNLVEAMKGTKHAVVLHSPAKGEDYAGKVPAYKNFAQYLLEGEPVTNKDGSVSGNLKAEVTDALAVAAFTWMNENAGKIYYKKEEVGNMFFLDDVKNIPYQTYNRMKTAGTYKDFVAEAIGNKAVNLLGYSFVKDVSADRKTKLAKAIGHIAVNQLLAHEYLEENAYNGEALQAMRQAIINAKGNADVTYSDDFTPGELSFIAPRTSTGDNKQVIGKTAKVLASNKGTNNLVAKMFGVPRGQQPVRFSPPKTKQKTTDSFGTEVPSFQDKQLEAAHKQRWNVSTDTHIAHTTFSNLDPDLLKEMHGFKNAEQLAQAQAMERDGIQAKNDAILREIQLFEDSLANLHEQDKRAVARNPEAKQYGLNRDFFLQQEVWKQQRSGMVNALNPVSSKIHRGLVNMKEHKVDLVLDSLGIAKSLEDVSHDVFINENGVTPIGEFFQAIALYSEDLEPEGVKTTADKTDILNYAPQYLKWMNGEGKPAITAMLKVLNNDSPTSEDLRLIADTVAAMGMQAMSLKALTNMARFIEAIEQGKGKFTSDIAIEIDGVTNGPWLTQMLLNTITAAAKRAGGAYDQVDVDNGITNIPAYKDQPNPDMNKDIYEQNAQVMTVAWQDVQDNIQNNPKLKQDYKTKMLNDMAAIDSLYPKFRERKGAKTLTTVINFGSGVGSTTEGIIGDFFDAVIDKLKASAGDQQAFSEVAADLNILLASHNSNSNNKPVDLIDPTAEDAIEFMFTDAQVLAISGVVGKPIKSMVKAFTAMAYGEYAQVRDSLTARMQYAFTLFNPLYEQEIKLKEEELDLDTNVEGLSAEAHKEVLTDLRDYTPLVETAMAARSSNKLESSLPAMKANRTSSTEARDQLDLYIQGGSKRNYLSKDFKLSKGTATGNIRHITSRIKSLSLTDPGVSMLPLSIHSLDAFIAHSTIGEFASMNIHDALSSVVGGGRELGKFLNQTTLEALTTTHVNVNFLNAMIRPMQAYVGNELMFDSQEAKNEFIDTLQTLAIAEGLITAEEVAEGAVLDHETVLNYIATSSYDRDITKLANLLETKVINQYGLQGGEYHLSKEDVNNIEAQIGKLTAEKAKVLGEINVLATNLDKAVGLNTTLTPEQLYAANPLGFYLNNHINGVDPKVVFKILKENIAKNHENGSPTAKVASYVFGAMNTLIPKDFNIQVVKRSEAAGVPNGLKMLMDLRPAWYNSNHEGKPTVFMFETSDVAYQEDVLLHELMHVATALALESTDPEVVKAKQDLEEIFEAFKDEMSKREMSEQYISPDMKYAQTSLDEFIAVAATNADVMGVLSGMRFQRDGNKMTTMLKQFVGLILQALNKAGLKRSVKPSPKEVNGVEAFLLGITELTSAYNESAQPVLAFKELGAPKASAKASVREMNSQDVLDNLDGTNTEFDEKLTKVMSKVANRIFDRFDNALLNQIGLSNDPESVWLDAVATGQTPYTNGASLHGFTMSGKERFVMEAVHAAVKAVATDRSLSMSYSELNKSFALSKSKVKPEDLYDGDWSRASKVDKDVAQAKWNYIFKITPEGDHLARFASMALGNESVAKVLSFANKESTPKADTLFEKVTNLLHSIIEKLGLMVIGAKTGSRMDSHVYDVLKSLAKVDLRHRNLVSNKIESAMAKFDQGVDKVVAKAKGKAADALDGKLGEVLDKTTATGLVGDIARSAAKDRLWEDMNSTKDLIMKSYSKGKLGFVGELVNEFSENTPFKTVVEKLMRQVKMSSQEKESLSEATQKNLLHTYKDKGKKLSKSAKVAITSMLRADVQSLMGKFSNTQIQKLYADPKYLAAQINLMQANLKANDVRALTLISRTKDLARYMVTGLGAKNNDLATNAMLIAMGASTARVIPMADVDPNTVELIDQLASLYAIKYTPADQKAALVDVMSKELGSTVNGIDTTLKFHKALSDEAKEQLFKENPLSAIKGFVPEITNPNHEIRFATNDKQAKNLKDQFFREVKTLQPNPLTPGNAVRMFISEDAGQTRMISGALEVFSQNAKGTPIELGNSFNSVYKSIIANQHTHANSNYDPFKDADSSAMIPRYDTQGMVIGYRYEMSGASRDALLERNNDFSELLGQYAATNYNKLNVPVLNEMVVDAVVEEYKKNHDKNPRNFIEVSPFSKDPELVKMWATLPQATRDYIRVVVGESKLVVPRDVLLPLFGYQKYSVMGAFDKDLKDRNYYERAYMAVFQAVFGNNARVYGARVERAMQEAVAVAKNMIVIRNVRTLVNNILSNTFLLQAHGASITDILKDTVVALRAGMQYRKDMALLTSKRQYLYSGVGDVAKLEQEVMQLEQSIANNPLIGFINEGMMPSIVDDVAMKANDDYSYQSAIGKKFSKQLDKVPEQLKTAGKWLMVSPDTPLYEFLNNTTQLSDFVAKYAMYNYYTKNAPKKDKLNHDEAIQMASDNFINYDMPTSKGMQYLNDMGIVMFTKYNLRIQKALFKLLQKRPARAMLQALVMHNGTDIPYGIDPIIWNQMGLPFRDGALILPDALGEPIPMQALGTIF